MSASAPEVVVEAVAEMPPAGLRQTIRRLDWRFLLPDPALGRVAYLGPASDSLAAALRASGAALAVITGPLADADRAAFDTVVAVDPLRESLAAAADLLCPGGWLYAEVSGGAGRSRRGRGAWASAKRSFTGTGRTSRAARASSHLTTAARWFTPCSRGGATRRGCPWRRWCAACSGRARSAGRRATSA